MMTDLMAAAAAGTAAFCHCLIPSIQTDIRTYRHVALPLGRLRLYAVEAENCPYCCGSHLRARKQLPSFRMACKRWFVSDACRSFALLLLAALELLQAAVAGHPKGCATLVGFFLQPKPCRGSSLSIKIKRVG